MDCNGLRIRNELAEEQWIPDSYPMFRLRFAPGASLEEQAPEAAGSVTAVKEPEWLKVFSFTAEAEGVATARIRSEFSLIRVSASFHGQLPVSAAAESSMIVCFRCQHIRLLQVRR